VRSRAANPQPSKRKDLEMRRNLVRSKTRKITVFLFMLASVLRFSFSAMAADDLGPCSRGNQVECGSYALTQLQNCVGSGTYCANKCDEDYTGCMVLKGCASPPPLII